ncbi:hypothetical protein P7D22_01715 [Lichenihabitans sp. Uapishka_5]|uniref:DUF6867 family protein n=1 Tax=Lichenihabitans sp. Uapishka_5 TaxID=3037302 RepID=UPI0029E81836|nr:hypothetical protein [Lichenihabitans sp. Uapishka_5]MDX7949892.1 hypothetical protein [Lichenihabitans sp. Uapishka_5]
MNGLLYTADDGGLLHFLLITVLIGGVLAWQAGRAIAGTWRGFWMVPLYMLLLAAGVRFLHYALVGEDLFSLQYFVVAFVLACLASGYGYRSRRSEQMSTQYSWIYRRSGPLGWAMKS